MTEPLYRPRCTPVLPLVYDESLSYYEYLCKIGAKLNELIGDINENLEQYIKEAMPSLIADATYIPLTETLVFTFETENGGS